jgi:hypothetical protein
MSDGWTIAFVSYGLAAAISFATAALMYLVIRAVRASRRGGS